MLRENTSADVRSRCRRWATVGLIFCTAMIIVVPVGVGLYYFGTRDSCRDLFRAIENGDLPKVEQLLASRSYRECRWITDRLPTGGRWTTPLHVAALHCRADMVSALLRHGIDVDVLDSEGRTAVRVVGWGKDEEARIRCIEMLIAAGVDLSIRDKQGYSAIHDAASANDAATLVILLKAACDPTLRGPGGITAIHMAAFEVGDHGGNEALKILLENGVDPNVQDDTGRTPLHYAAYSKRFRNREAIRILLEHGADTRIVDNSGISGSEAMRRVNIE